MNKMIGWITAAIVALSTAAWAFWTSVCPIINACPAEETEVVAPTGNTTTNKTVTLDGSAESNWGDANGSVEVWNIQF